jgi:hypothetical protein
MPVNRAFPFSPSGRRSIDADDFPSENSSWAVSCMIRILPGDLSSIRSIDDAASACGFRADELFSRDMAARLGQALDTLLDVTERFEAGFNCVGRDISQHVGCDGVAQTVEIIDKLAAALRQK